MKFTLRKALLKDVPFLVKIEEESFNSDKMNKAQFVYAIKKGHSSLIVATKAQVIAGYGLLFYHKNTSLCRLYSLATSKNFRGQGVASTILKKLEKEALENDCSYIRLEVNVNNRNAINLYQSRGYSQFNYKKEYYEDHSDALCLEKKIRKYAKKPSRNVPFYHQTTDFTCGPSSLIMAMKGLNQTFKIDKYTELDIWRESTTIFMTSGHGGCGPHGLALAAHMRGFKTELFLSKKTPLFIESVRDEKKKKVIALVQNGFEVKLKKEKIKTHYSRYGLDTVRKILDSKGVALVLISSYRLTETKTPHWIVITGIEEDFLYFHDPDLSGSNSPTENIDIPIRVDEFVKIARYGKNQLKCIVGIWNKKRPR